ncbi:chemotaxis protein CheB [Pseudohalocynthiibacter aestuariivivens]|uniref:Chemotaxis protein CheB n=1 Tax=Pseudohalocynthiibacter aestuariivivens TaxID=1591409 RepID=A0ABV5JDD4_9RHOB|nr:chemotaxis protein CheB [Pseudohalocynthiibacter aestuariivivens]MBS9718852.1 PAS domain S-box protein [Pseudohalocynthiibacter aestuariivivens]
MARKPKLPAPGPRTRQTVKPTTTRKSENTKKTTKPTPSSETKPTIPIVGLGASAGGLQALTDFFKVMPSTSGLAFVVIHHVDPDHESLMASLLSKHTKMQVDLAQDLTPIRADHVYIIPPNHFLSIKQGVLHLSEPKARRGMRLPIDFFLRSLAVEQKNNAIAVILSGTGSDGTTGIKSIKEYGGMVLVQDPKEADYDGMPRSAIATGSADHVLSVKKMPKVVSDFVKHPYVSRKPLAKVLGETARDSFEEIVSLLKAHSPIDFERYKDGTLLRRIERRMALKHLENSKDYLALLQDSPEECERLCSDFLIVVTSFFRNPEAFEYLNANVLHDLVSNHKKDQPIRVWVPACATGEEAYSLAILLIEWISSLRKNIKLQIFASDVDERALSVARAGVYPDSIAEDVTPERLDRFFTKEDHSYRVSSELRESIVFANQNLLSDAPFSKLDLISCRNVLIYLDPSAQCRILQMFHFALINDGLLMLGLSETIGNQDDLFAPLSSKYRLFKRIGSSLLRKVNFTTRPATLIAGSQSALSPTNVNQRTRLADLCQKLLIEQYAPAAVLINASMETLFVQGAADKYLKVPVGEASQDLLAMVREGLRAKLSSAIRQAIKENKEISGTATLSRDKQKIKVNIRVHPVNEDGSPLFLVTFSDQQTIVKELGQDSTEGDQAAFHHMEQELDATKQDLRNTIHDFELSTEELKSANEEAMSLNEEFQSTNEELETSKEELQSLNEELLTLNTQLQQKVEDERSISEDLNNLLSSSEIATIFLDRQLNIMRFTPATRKIFNVIANDEGRPFSDITGKINDPDILKDARKVLQDHTPIEIEVPEKTGKWYLRRILPYRTQEGKISGLVITFIDVSDLKILQKNNEAAQLFAENIVDTVREPLVVLDKSFRIIRASRSFYAAFKTRPVNIENLSIFDIQDCQWDIPNLRKLLERVLPEKETVESFEITIDTTEAGARDMVLSARKIEQKGFGDELILLAIEDVTERKKIQNELIEREARLAIILNSAPDAIITITDEGTVQSFNAAAERIFGFTTDEMIGQNVSKLMADVDRDAHDSYLSNYLKTGEKKIIGIGREVVGCRKDGREVPLRLTVSEHSFSGSQQFVGVLHDLTEERKRREELQQAKKMEAVGQLTGGFAHDFNNLLTAVIGNLELLEMRVKDDALRDLLSEAQKAAEMGAELTTRLLAFSRRQPLEPKNVQINELVVAMRPLLKSTVGKEIKYREKLDKGLAVTLTDPSQIENALLNMTINARDAMPDGGVLKIETRNVVLDQDYTDTQIGVSAGHYVALSVSDTGTGMTNSVLEKAFEPFFTTKETGYGSGLGLSMIYGFAKQSNGHLAIYSEPGKGTTVNLYLSVSHSTDENNESEIRQSSLKAANETILVVEDDPLVRRLTVSRLQDMGYQVVEAVDGPKAIAILKKKNSIDLVFSDIMMPGGMTGFDVAEEALSINPELKVLLASGFADMSEIETSPHKVLRKPYSISTLAQNLRKLLS